MRGHPCARAVVAVLLLSLLSAPAMRAMAAPGDAPQPVAQPAAQPTPRTTDAGLPDELAERLEDAMARLAEQTKADAMESLEARDYPTAFELLNRAQAIDPDDPAVNHQLGRLHMLLGQRAEAEQHLRRALAAEVGGAVAGLALADLLAEPPTTEPGLVEAASLLRAARLRSGPDPTIVLRQARVAAARGHFEEAQQFYAGYQTLQPDVSNALRLELGDLHRDHGHKEEALGWYRQIDAGDPARQRQAAQRIFELSAQREAEHLVLASQSPEVVRHARQQVSQARMLIAEGKLERADELLHTAITAAPLFAPAHAALADVSAARAEQGSAEIGYLRAIVLGAGEGQTYASLGTLYARWLPRPRNAEAAVMLQRALQSRPDLGELHRLLAQCLRATGDLPRALMHARAYQKAAQDDATRRFAARLVQQLQSVVGGDGHMIEVIGTPPSTAVALARAHTHLGAGATDAALAELRALDPTHAGVEVLNLEARILIAAGRDAEARSALQRSVQRDDSQATIHAILGRVLARMGDHTRSLAHMRRAQELGDLGALLEVVAARAGQDAVAGDVGRLASLHTLRARLDDTRFVRATPEVRGARAELAMRLDARIQRSLLALIATAVILLVLALLWRWRRSGGIDLSALTMLHPETAPQVQQILLSLRHEVLKHNTTLLTGLIEGLERGEPDGRLARHLADALFDDGGALQRLQAYAEQLVQLGRSHGHRINLRRRDPVLSEILWGFARLRGVRAQLEGLENRRGGGSRSLLRALRDANAAINERGYQQLQSLLQELQVFRVDAADLHAIFDAVRREPSIASRAVDDLHLEADERALPCPLKIARHDFDDILTNLLRNAIQSSARSLPDDQPIAIGLRVEVEVDDITGLEEALLHVLDCSTEQLTTDALRHQIIERGLGLTADRVNRYDGSLDVQPDGEGPWTKAVVLRLPVAP